MARCPAPEGRRGFSSRRRADPLRLPAVASTPSAARVPHPAPNPRALPASKGRGRPLPLGPGPRPDPTPPHRPLPPPAVAAAPRTHQPLPRSPCCGPVWPATRSRPFVLLFPPRPGADLARAAGPGSRTPSRGHRLCLFESCVLGYVGNHRLLGHQLPAPHLASGLRFLPGPEASSVRAESLWELAGDRGAPAPRMGLPVTLLSQPGHVASLLLLCP